MRNDPFDFRKNKRRLKKKVKKLNGKKKPQSDDEEDEELKSSIVQIDNLPNDINSLRKMLLEVNSHIKDLEIQFLEEEDSENEAQLKLATMSVEKHDEKLMAL